MDRVETSKKFYVLINDKKSISMNGVSNVRAFDESYVTLETEQGTVNVEGASLKIESLTKESGEIFKRGSLNVDRPLLCFKRDVGLVKCANV